MELQQEELVVEAVVVLAVAADLLLMVVDQELVELEMQELQTLAVAVEVVVIHQVTKAEVVVQV